MVNFAFLSLLATACTQALPQQLLLELNLGNAEFPLKIDSCPLHLPATCTNSTPIDNICCFESPGGILLLTQFWDYKPAVGGPEEFTLHGLWPDNCDGTYEQSCDAQLNIRKGDAQEIVEKKYNNAALWQQMKTSWRNLGGDDELLWIHEFNKHGTCVKTIRPECYGSAFLLGENVYDYFRVTLDLFSQYPTFEFLKQQGIVPLETATYSKKQIAEALSSKFDNKDVFFKCDYHGALQEIRYYHHLRGPLSKADFVQIDALHSSQCPENGIKFIPKGARAPPAPPKNPSANRGYLKLTGQSGCLISNGQRYTQGTCATFRLLEAPFGGYNLLSSKGVCGVDENGELVCNRANSKDQFQFQFNADTRELGYGNIYDWCYAPEHKHGTGKFAQTPIKLADKSCESFRVVLD